MSELGPDEGINALQHPDCRACAERERLSLGQIAENRALKSKVDPLQADRRAFLSAFKVWKDATEKRCRLLSSREATDSTLFPDRAFIEAVEQIRAERESNG